MDLLTRLPRMRHHICRTGHRVHFRIHILGMYPATGGRPKTYYRLPNKVAVFRVLLSILGRPDARTIRESVFLDVRYGCARTGHMTD